MVKNKRLALTTAILMALSLNAAAKDSGYLFVSSEKDNVVTVLDSESYEVIKQIGTAERPRHLQFNADRTLIYAACGDGNAIDVIDVGDMTLADRIVGIDDPEAFDLSADGRAMFISLEDDAKLGILDLDTYFAERGEMPELTIAEAAPEDEVFVEDEEDEDEEESEGGTSAMPGLTTIETGAEPEGVLAHPDGSTVYVTSEVANIVHVIDLENREITANIVAGIRPRRFALTPDRSELWVTNELSGSVSIIDPSTHQITDTIEFLPPGFRPEDVTPVGITMTSDGGTAFIGLGRANHVAVVDVISREIEEYILVGSRAWNTTLNRDNSVLYVVNGLSDDVSVVDVASRRVTTSFPVGRVPYALLIDD